MRSTILKPTDLHAPGALAQLFAYNRQRFGGWVMEDTGSGAGGDGGAGGSGADDDKGKAGAGDKSKGSAADDLGFPKDTPVADMTPEQRAAYDRNKREQNKAERQRWRSVTGDRSPEQLKADLDRLAELEKAQMTASDRAIADAKEAGATEARTAERTVTATTIYEAALETLGVPETEIPDLIRGFNAAAFVTDNGVDRAAITTFAKKVAPAGTADQRRRDFGGGNRNLGNGAAGAAGKAEAAKRFGTKTQTGA